MNGKHVRFTVEVLQDHGMESTGTVTKCYVTRTISDCGETYPIYFHPSRLIDKEEIPYCK